MHIFTASPGRVLAILLLGQLAGCSEPAGPPAADLIFTNARVYTVDARESWAEAVAIRGGELVYVGDAPGAETLLGDRTRRVDLGGRLVLPGFIDAHTHVVLGGVFVLFLSLDTFGTIDDWVQAIADYAADNPDEEILFGYGFLSTTFGPTGPTRQLLDAIEPDRPILIMDEGFHGAWANTAALDALNITRDTPDPVPGFGYYKRDANGDATGYLLETAALQAMEDLEIISEDVVVDGTATLIDMMNAYGVTAAFDASAESYDGYVPSVMSRVEAAGDLSLRFVGSYRPEGPEQAGTAVATVDERRRTLRGEHYRIDTLKIMDDGTVEGRTAAMFEDYQGEPGNSGATLFTESEKTDMLVAAAKLDIDVHIHSLGERAVHEALNAIEVARELVPASESRYTLTHIQVITDADVPRFGELDVIAQSTPLWAAYDTYGEQFVSPDQFQRYWRFRSLRDAGARLTFGSDYPSSGAGTLGMSPLIQIEIGHTRQEAGNPAALVQPRESERLPVADLVRGFTIDAAYQLHMEDEIGSIEVGKKADLVVLDRDIFSIDPYEIHATEVLLTVFDGDIVYGDLDVLR